MAARKTTWFDTEFNFDTASAGQAVKRLTPSSVIGGTVIGEGLTSVRLLLTLELHPSIPEVVNSEQLVSFGVGLASEEAFGAQILPDPKTVTDFPPRGWVIRDQALVADRAGDARAVVRLIYDIRAMRKIDNFVMYLIMDNEPIRGTAFTVRMIGLVRVLCKLP